MGVYVFSKRALHRWLDEDRPDFGSDVIPAMLDGGARVFGYRFDGYWQDVGTIQSLLGGQHGPPRGPPGARPVRQGVADPHPVGGARAGQDRADRPGPPEPDQPRLRDRRDGRELRPLARRRRRRRRGRPRLDRHVRHRHPAGRGRRPGDPRQGGHRRARARSSARAPTSTRPNRLEPSHLNTGITIVGKRAVIPRGVRIGRNVRIDPNVRATDYGHRMVESGGTVERRETRRAVRLVPAAEPEAGPPPSVPVAGRIGRLWARAAGTGRRPAEHDWSAWTIGRVALFVRPAECPAGRHGGRARILRRGWRPPRLRNRREQRGVDAGPGCYTRPRCASLPTGPQGDPVRRIGRRLLRPRPADPRARGPGPDRHDGGLRPRVRRPVRDRRGEEPPRPRPRRTPTPTRPSSRRSTTATSSRPRRSFSGSGPATASSGCTRRPSWA